MSANPTSKLSLGAIRDQDFESVISILKNSVVSETYMVPEITTEEQASNLFNRLKTISECNDRYFFAIFLDDKLIGLIHDTDICDKTVEVGYALHPDYFGKGYMTRALNMVINRLFDAGFYEVVAGAFEENVASIRVMQKCGMKSTGKNEVIEYHKVKHLCVFYSIKNNQ